jgi:hypothetical protein
MPPLKSLDLFTGVGGLTHALRGLAEPVGYCEKDPECRDVLARLMRTGQLPRAPVHDDIAKLSPSALSRVDLVVAGFPCIGFSVSGMKDGLRHPGSRLFYKVMGLARAIKPPFMFFENVDAILGNNDINKIVSEISRAGYDMCWAVMPAFSVGAPQKRSRWFCMCVRRGVAGLRLRVPKYTRFSWAREPKVRMVPHRPPDQKRRMRMLGNSVVPDCARAAFLSLFTGCTVPIPKLLEASSVALLAPKPLAPLMPEDDKKYGCVVDGKRFRIPSPPGMLPIPPKGRLVLDPKAYSVDKPVSKDATSGFITERFPMRMWNTPRATNGASSMNVLTNRGRCDLGVQLRFEEKTPESQRGGVPNPEFAEWLMGLPRGWTSS